METQSHATIDLDMIFPVANVMFNIQVRPDDDHQANSLRIQLKAVEGEREPRFNAESSRTLSKTSLAISIHNIRFHKF
jgi:hypothetical protein